MTFDWINILDADKRIWEDFDCGYDTFTDGHRLGWCAFFGAYLKNNEMNDIMICAKTKIKLCI